MKYLRLLPTISLMLCLVINLGCRRRPVETQTIPSPQQKEVSSLAEKAPPQVKIGQKMSKLPEETKRLTLETPKIPEVKLTGSLIATCVVKVGQPMPDNELADLEGNVQSFQAFYGENLTVIFFWSSKNMYALSELKDLSSDVANPFKDRGVNVIAINVGDPPEVARREAEKANATYTMLVDPHGEYFSQVATDGIPRTYVVGANGKIIWFDVEYSRSTRRDLFQTIESVLKQKQEREPSSKNNNDV